MKIVLVSGKAQHGKDTTANIIANKLITQSKKVIIFHYADYLKYIAKQYYNWNGEKDENGRHLLQYLGTDVCRKNNPNIWAMVALEFSKAFKTECDYIIIPDVRFKNEVNIWKDSNFEHIEKVFLIRVNRPNFDNGLTQEQQLHASEIDLDDCKSIDFFVENDKTLIDLEKTINNILDKIGE